MIKKFIFDEKLLFGAYYGGYYLIVTILSKFDYKNLECIG